MDHEVDPEATNLTRRFDQLLPAVVAVAKAYVDRPSISARKLKKKLKYMSSK